MMSEGGLAEVMTAQHNALDNVLDSVLREQLLDRREKLEEAAALSGDFELANLLGEVDDELDKMNAGT